VKNKTIKAAGTYTNYQNIQKSYADRMNDFCFPMSLSFIGNIEEEVAINFMLW
jgi:hypothetical protein